MKLRDLKKGDFFTRKPITEPTETQVFIKGDYDRTDRKYECTRFSDACSWVYLKPDTEVYTDFTF